MFMTHIVPTSLFSLFILLYIKCCSAFFIELICFYTKNILLKLFVDKTIMYIIELFLMFLKPMLFEVAICSFKQNIYIFSSPHFHIWCL